MMEFAYSLFWAVLPFIAGPLAIYAAGRHIMASYRADMHARSFNKAYVVDSGQATPTPGKGRMARALWDGR